MVSEEELFELLVKRFPVKEYACFYQVRNATGYVENVRTADAIVMGLWPSRGLDLHGFEFKVQRGNWLSEKKTPEKAEMIAKYCDFWWVVAANEEIIKEDEIPTKWGWMVSSGKKLITKKKPERLEAIQIDHSFLASLLRNNDEANAQRYNKVVPVKEIKSRIEKAKHEGEKWGKERVELKIKPLEHEIEHLKNAISDFEKVSGVKIEKYSGVQIGRAVRSIMELKRNKSHEAIAQISERVKDQGERLSELAKEVEKNEKQIELIKNPVRKYDGTKKKHLSAVR